MKDENDKVKLSKKAMLKEHIRLVRALKTKKPNLLNSETKEQGEELKEMKQGEYK